MRLAFMGSPDFAVPALRALAKAGHEIAAVYCQPPRPAGRGHAVRRCPVHDAALALDLEVRTPARLRRNEAEHAAFAALDLDAAVVAAYGLILPEAMLAAPRRGCLNIHASLLPRWRGAAPIQAAILAGDAESGVTIMQMDAGLDTGPMLLAEAVPIGARRSSGIRSTTANRSERPTCGAASPIPGARYMMSNMCGVSARTSASCSARTGGVRRFSTGCGAIRIDSGSASTGASVVTFMSGM